MSRRGKGWVVGVGGGGGWGLNTGSPLQGHFKTGSHPCVVIFFSGALFKLMKSTMWIILLNVGVSVVLMQINEDKTIEFLCLVMFCLPDPFTLRMPKETKQCLTNCFP